ncbi:hypothetical protein MJ588_25385 [Klebsiella pneumoniae]|nr:hypothetical protein MJ588_25385 [Klebsiella pneumoniae]
MTTASGQKVAFVQYLSSYAVGAADQRNLPHPTGPLRRSRLY